MQRTQGNSVRMAVVVAALLLVSPAAHASVEISAAPTSNMNCSAGVCSPTAKKAVLNVTDLTNMLASGDVKLTTGNGAVAITVSSPFSWVSTHRLTLDAYQIVSFRAPVTVAGTGAVTITYNDGGTGGDLIFFPGAKIDFNQLSSNLVINGENYTLASDVHSLAANNSGFVALANDYDAHVDGPYLSPPIAAFGGGVLEGLGHTISNVTIKNNSTAVCAVGFLGGVYASGTVRDISVTNVRVSSVVGQSCGPLYIGALIGINAGVVFGSEATGKVRGGTTEFAGGLVGDNQGTITESSTDMLVDGSSVPTVQGPVANGGLVGRNEAKGIVIFSSTSGKTAGTGDLAVGGLIGLNWGRVANSWSDGQVAVPQGLGVGGLVGDNFGQISSSHSSSAVHTQEPREGYPMEVGGLVGTNDYSIYGTGVVDQSFATGSLSGGQNTQLGGLVGENVGTVEDSYATGAVTLVKSAYGLAGGFVCTNGAANNVATITTSYSTGAISGIGGGYRGGFIAYDAMKRNLIANYWDLDTSGISDPSKGAGRPPNDPGIMGSHDAQLKSGLPSGFDPHIWGQKKSINGGYPYLLANPPPQ